MATDRRTLLLSAGAASLGTGKVALAQTTRSAPTGDGYFLSASNPVATRDQKDLEELCLRLQQHPEVRAAIQRTSAMWARL